MATWEIILTIIGAIGSIVISIVVLYFKIVDVVQTRVDNFEKAQIERADREERRTNESRVIFEKKLDGYIEKLSDIAANLESYKDIKEACFNRFDNLEQDNETIKQELAEVNNRLNNHITDMNRHNGK